MPTERTADNWIGELFGPYRVIALSSHSPMGSVYEAAGNGGSISAKVSLRILPDIFFHSAAAQTHFARERRLLARLDHPNIARVIDSGAIPAPYLVTELQDGVPLKRYCQEFSVKKSVRVFLDICDAMQFAHERLILHRDLKSSNILVTQAGEPRILNFGVANLIPEELANADKDRLDPTAPHFFTPDYASPEQFRGEPLGVASDIYSLGVILYELLTGRPPHVTTGLNAAETKRLIFTVDPVLPSEAAPSDRKALRGDLDYIILKAVQKDPAQRYGSVESMATDLRRHLLGMPAADRKAPPIERASKFLRKNPSAAAGLLVVVAILGVAFFQVRRSKEHFRESRELSARILLQMSDSLANLPDAGQSRDLLMSLSQNYLDFLNRQAGNDSGMLSELASGYSQIAGLQAVSEGGAEAALASYERSGQLWQRVLRARPHDASALRSATVTCQRHGDLLVRMGRKGDADNAYAMATTSAGAAVKASPGDPDILVLAAVVWAGSAERRAAAGDAAGAQAAMEQAVSLCTRAISVRKTDRNLDSLAVALLRLGRMASGSDQPAKARAHLEESIGILGALAQSHPGVATYLSPLGVAETSLGAVFDSKETLSLRDAAAAEVHYRRGLELAQAAAAAAPQDREAQADRVIAYSSLCETVAEVRPAEALSTCQLARDVAVAAAEKSQSTGLLQYATIAEIGMARADLKLNRAPDAVVSAESAVRRMTAVGSLDALARMRVLVVLGDALTAQRQPERALSSYYSAQAVAGLDFHAMNYAKLQLLYDIGSRVMEVAPARRCAGFRDAAAAAAELKSRGWPVPSTVAAPAGCGDK